MTYYDLIGDIHGHADKLEELLQKLGYQKDANGTYHHATRKVIFAGDFIDRGPKVRAVLQIAKAMTDAGSALAVMGNHEYNYLCYNTQNSEGEYLRLHTDKNRKQQQATEDAFIPYPDELQTYLNWMMQLPLWLDLGDLRIIHACWQPDMIKRVEGELNGNQLTPNFLQQSAIKENWQFEYLETLLKGMEKELPEGVSFLDKDGTKRTAMRLRWWKKPHDINYTNYGLEVDLDQPIPEEWSNNFFYPDNDVPVFMGHYWLKGQPALLTPNVCCLDYSVAKGGHLTAYRHDGEQVLKKENLIWV